MRCLIGTQQRGSSCRGQPKPRAIVALCPRLVAFRSANQASEPAWFNGAVPSFGRESADSARLLIVGLAPGLKGANRTGRPFTGDFAGDLLYETLLAFGFARGRYEASPDDGLELVDCMITNAVRCVPPENKPTPAEIATCRPFLAAAHGCHAAARGHRRARAHRPRQHAGGARVRARRASRSPTARATTSGPGLVLFDSFHCSRYNTNTGKLTPEMFRAVFAAVREHLGTPR